MMNRPDRSKCVPNDQSELTSLLLVSLFFYRANHLDEEKGQMLLCEMERRKGKEGVLT